MGMKTGKSDAVLGTSTANWGPQTVALVWAFHLGGGNRVLKEIAF